MRVIERVIERGILGELNLIAGRGLEGGGTGNWHRRNAAQHIRSG